MARAIERIERDIIALNNAIGAIALELQSAYANYLTTLGQALKQQLVLATYHLCTQGYPENFLNLSLNQRQQLQQAIRKLGKVAAQELLTYTSVKEDEFESGTEKEDTTEANPTKSRDLSNPIELVMWQQNLEQQMQEAIKTLSRDANVLLQKAGILPKKLPEPILETDRYSVEASAEIMPAPPNLLNLIVEIEQEEESEESNLTQIMAINLRLGEIEFADATLSAARKQIRYILGQLNKLGREYQKRQRERSVAEAEAVWRASWYED